MAEQSSFRRRAKDVLIGISVEKALPLLLSLAAAIVVTALSGLHGWWRPAFLIVAAAAGTLLFVQAGHLLVAALPEKYAKALDHDARHRAVTDALAGHRWRMRSTASFIAAELSGNLKTLQDAAADRSYPVDLQLASAAWEEWSVNLAGDEEAQEAHRLAADAYNEFARLGRLVAEDSKRFGSPYVSVMDAHRLSRTIEAAAKAEEAVRSVGARY